MQQHDVKATAARNQWAKTQFVVALEEAVERDGAGLHHDLAVEKLINEMLHRVTPAGNC